MQRHYFSIVDNRRWPWPCIFLTTLIRSRCGASFSSSDRIRPKTRICRFLTSCELHARVRFAVPQAARAVVVTFAFTSMLLGRPAVRCSPTRWSFRRRSSCAFRDNGTSAAQLLDDARLDDDVARRAVAFSACLHRSRPPCRRGTRAPSARPQISRTVQVVELRRLHACHEVEAIVVDHRGQSRFRRCSCHYWPVCQAPRDSWK